MRQKYYVIKLTKGKYYSTKEGWTKDIYKAWLFDSKKVHGFDIKDFPKGTTIVPVKMIMTLHEVVG